MSCRGISGAYGGPCRYYISSAYEGAKDRPSLVDDYPAVQKVNNLCSGEGNPVEGG